MPKRKIFVNNSNSNTLRGITEQQNLEIFVKCTDVQRLWHMRKASTYVIFHINEILRIFPVEKYK